MKPDLFDPGTDDRADPATVSLLAGYGYRPEAVRLWPAAKARAALTARRREEGIARRRSQAEAARVDAADGVPARGSASRPERETAARSLEQATGADDLTQAVAYSVYCLTDDETRRLSGYLVKLFRTPVEDR